MDYKDNNCAYVTVQKQLRDQGRHDNPEMEQQFWNASRKCGFTKGTPMPEEVFDMFCEINKDVAILVLTEDIKWSDDRVTYVSGSSRLYCHSDKPVYFVCIKRQNTDPAHWAPCTKYTRDNLRYLCERKQSLGITIWGPDEIPDTPSSPDVRPPCQLCAGNGDIVFHPEEECAWASPDL